MIRYWSRLMTETDHRTVWQWGGREETFLEIYGLIKKYKPDIVVPVTLNISPNLSRAMQEERGGLLAVPHPFLNASFACALEKIGIVSYSITIDPMRLRDSGVMMGMKTTPSALPKNNSTLIRARSRVEAEEFVVNAVDYLLNGSGTAQTELFISPNFFQFARVLKCNLYFGLTHVSETGILYVTIEKSHSHSDQGILEEFTAFLAKHRKVFRNWEMRREVLT